MFFYASKIVWFLLQPSGFLLASAVFACALVWTRWWRIGRRLLLAVVVGLTVASLSPLGNVMVLPLEDRFPRPEIALGERIEGIIVLGGALSPGVSGARRVTALNEAGERLTVAATLARRFPDARIVFTGGTANILIKEAPEAAFASKALVEFGVEARRIRLEANSRNTYENALHTRALVKPRPGARWILLTSAAHMPRAVGCFRRVGFPVIAWPVDYRTRGRADLWRFFSSPTEGLRSLDWAVHEWLGLVAYRLTGRIGEFLPGPRSAE